MRQEPEPLRAEHIQEVCVIGRREMREQFIICNIVISNLISFHPICFDMVAFAIIKKVEVKRERCNWLKARNKFKGEGC